MEASALQILPAYVSSMQAPETSNQFWILDLGQDASNLDNLALLESINSSGGAFMVHTELAGRVAIRFAVGGTWTQVRDVPNCIGAVTIGAFWCDLATALRLD